MLITTSIVASELVPANSSRKSILIINESAVDTVYIKVQRSEVTNVSATDHDFRLGPGAGISLSALFDGVATLQSRFTVIASANAPVVSVLETTDQRS
ncbi:MAG: hypothetical protein IT275_12690 [Chitinophagales bacterium]|nr:hypothetical protein [Chitinophagales bacterium]